MEKFSVVLLSLTLLSCVSMNTTNLAPNETFDPVPKEQVRIFQSADKVPEPFVKLALFNASGSDMYTDESDLYGKMREKASERGCNGIVLQSQDDAGTAEKIFFGAGADQEARAVCVRYGEEVEPDESDTGSDADRRLPVIEV